MRMNPNGRKNQEHAYLLSKKIIFQKTPANQPNQKNVRNRSAHQFWLFADFPHRLCLFQKGLTADKSSWHHLVLYDAYQLLHCRIPLPPCEALSVCDHQKGFIFKGKVPQLPLKRKGNVIEHTVLLQHFHVHIAPCNNFTILSPI